MSTSRTPKLTGCIDVVYLPPVRQDKNSLALHPGDRCREHVDTVVRRMDESGVAQVFITPCKIWACDRSHHCDSSELDDVLRFTSPFPKRFVGIAGYNPFFIAATLRRAGEGIRDHGFRGVYCHPSLSGVTPNDRRMYPLYEKAAEWAVPVILDLRPLAHENPASSAHAIEQIGNDFPELSCVLAHADFTAEQMLRLTDQLPNLHFSFDTASLLFPEVREFIRHEVGQSRSMWGSNGVPWKSAISELRRVGLPRRDAILKHNASRVFGLNSQAKQKARAYSQLAARDITMRAE